MQVRTECHANACAGHAVGALAAATAAAQDVPAARATTTELPDANPDTSLSVLHYPGG